jgi:hypothetical protein
MGALYDALVAAHVPEEQARKAAEEVADYNERIGRIERDLTVLKWMVVRTSCSRSVYSVGSRSFASRSERSGAARC